MKEYKWRFIHRKTWLYFYADNFDLACKIAEETANSKEDLLLVQLNKPTTLRGNIRIVHPAGIDFPPYKTKQDIVDIYDRSNDNISYILNDNYVHHYHNKGKTKIERW